MPSRDRVLGTSLTVRGCAAIESQSMSGIDSDSRPRSHQSPFPEARSPRDRVARLVRARRARRVSTEGRGSHHPRDPPVTPFRISLPRVLRHDARDSFLARRVIGFAVPARANRTISPDPWRRGGPAGRSARSIRPGRHTQTGRHIPGSSPARRRRCRACSRFTRPTCGERRRLRYGAADRIGQASRRRRVDHERHERQRGWPFRKDDRQAHRHSPVHDRLGVSAAIKGSEHGDGGGDPRAGANTSRVSRWESTFPTVDGNPSSVISGSSTLPTNGTTSPMQPVRRERRRASGSSQQRRRSISVLRAPATTPSRVARRLIDRKPTPTPISAHFSMRRSVQSVVKASTTAAESRGCP